ncbi:hypothetical protein HK096_005319, partial [Nowakowskiella sp. JEL0078]
MDNDILNMTFVPWDRQFIISFGAAQGALIFHPREVETRTELAYSVIETLMVAVVYGALFANLHSVVKLMISKEEFKAAKLAALKAKRMKEFMIKQQFPPELQEKIMSHQHFYFLKHHGVDENRLLLDLPGVLQQSILDSLYLEMI